MCVGLGFEQPTQRIRPAGQSYFRRWREMRLRRTAPPPGSFGRASVRPRTSLPLWSRSVLSPACVCVCVVYVCAVCRVLLPGCSQLIALPDSVRFAFIQASDFQFRMLSRRYGAELCFTPMMNARAFVRTPFPPVAMNKPGWGIVLFWFFFWRNPT